MPGGRQAYMPAVKVSFSRRSVIEPSTMYTSSQQSWVWIPLGVVSVPGAKRISELATPVSGSVARMDSVSVSTLPAHGVNCKVSVAKNSRSGLAIVGKHLVGVGQDRVRVELQLQAPVPPRAERTGQQRNRPAEHDEIVVELAERARQPCEQIGRRTHHRKAAPLVGVAVHIRFDVDRVPRQGREVI